MSKQNGKTTARGEGPEPAGAAAETATVAELVARFQLHTETLLSEARQEQRRDIERLQRNVGQLQTDVAELKGTYGELLRRFEDGAREWRAATTECNVALRQAVAQADKATAAAQVYEKLRDAQPDFFGMVRAVERRMGEVQDRMRVLGEQVNGLQGTVDAHGAQLGDVKAETKSNSRMLENPRLGLVEVR